MISRKGDAREKRGEMQRTRRQGQLPSPARPTIGASTQARSLGGKKAAKANAQVHEQQGYSYRPPRVRPARGSLRAGLPAARR